MGTQSKGIPQKSKRRDKEPFRIGVRSIEPLPFADTDKAVFYFDEDLKGFGLRVSRSSKSYIVQARVAGKKTRVKIGTYPEMKPEAARKEAQRLLGQMAEGTDPNASKSEQRSKKATLSDLWQEYQNDRKLRPTTIKVYESALKLCFSDWLDKPFLSITKDMVQARHKKISTRVGPKSKPEGAEAHANQAMRVLRSLLNYAGSKYEDSKGRSILPENPVKRLSQVKAWNKNKRRSGVIPGSKLKDWYQAVMAIKNDTQRDYLLLCLFTGLRRNEAAGLKWTDIDFDEKYFRIAEEDVKTHQEHVLPLTDYLSELLEERRAIHGDSTYVFPNRRDPRRHLVESKFTVAEVAKKAGVEFMVHDLRRTFLSIAEILAIPHYTIKKLANHKTSSDVTAGYIQLRLEDLRRPMELISDHILVQVGLKTKADSSATQRFTDTYEKLSVVQGVQTGQEPEVEETAKKIQSS